MAEEINFEELFSFEDDSGGSSEDTTKKEQNTSEELDLTSILEETINTEETDESGEEKEEEQTAEDVNKDSNGESPAPDSDKSSEKSSDDNVPATLLFARFLSEQGNLTSFNEEDFLKDLEDSDETTALSNLWNKEVEKIREGLLEDYEEDVKNYLDLVDSGVDPEIAKDTASSKKFFDSINKADLQDDDKEELRKDILRHKYRLTTRFDDKKIEKLIERTVSLGEDIEEAEEAVDELKQYYAERIVAEKKQAIAEQEKYKELQKNQLKELKEKIDKVEEVVPGIKLTPKVRQDIFEKITKPVKEINGQPVNSIWAKRLEDPFKFDTIIATLDSMGIFDGKWDKLLKNTKTKTIDDLKKKLDSNTSFKTKPKASNLYSDLEADDALNSMKGVFKF
ncbi:MAG: hypothetical protein RBT05_00755 [Bacteroidales bacterium]|jgi:hypothetical protein|nr:hypothetical protein [Bacteroidales bacterium]